MWKCYDFESFEKFNKRNNRQSITSVKKKQQTNYLRVIEMGFVREFFK